ncbi:MAG: hypothetical protein DSY77_12955 [Bacteroidetes bacterium]|jgi:hypothetical protein|nr:MAG: hypothetical protein DSY77_12955 [Bacteroidota bacterium]
MKKSILFVCLLILSINLKAQEEEKYYDADDRPKFYFGIGTGVNTFTGLAGLSANYIIDKTLFLQGGLGLSSWGIRSSIGLRYDQSYTNGLTFGFNLARSSGINDIVMTFDSGNGSVNEVNMRMESVSTLNFKTGYNWWFGKHNTFNMSIGYAIPFKNQPWAVTDGSTLSPMEQQILQLVAPGGIILEAGITFGIQ